MITFSSISTVVAEVYDVSDTTVSMCYTVFLIFCIGLNFPASQALETYGMAKCFRVSCVCIILAGWFRWVIMAQTNRFEYMLIGQGICAIFQPFLYNGISMLATRWFPDNQRAFATCIGSLSEAFGGIIGMFLGPLYISDDLKDDPETGKKYMN